MKAIGKIGSVEIARIFDTSLVGETAQSWFPDFNRAALEPHEHWLCPHHYNRESGHIHMPVQSWVLNVNGRKVLVDTCVGNHKQRPGVPEMHLLNTAYLERLASLDVDPADIDFVLCTHLHPDHVGWNTQLANGRWVPTFPNAKYVFSRLEYGLMKSAAEAKDCLPVIRNTFADSIHPIVEAGKALLVEDNHEVLDCIMLTPAPGHSPGHVRIDLKSQGEYGVFVGDIVHSPIQIPMWQWNSRICWDGRLAAISRRTMFEFCVENNALLLSTHFADPHVGRIRLAGDTFGIDFGW